MKSAVDQKHINDSKRLKNGNGLGGMVVIMVLNQIAGMVMSSFIPGKSKNFFLFSYFFID